MIEYIDFFCLTKNLIYLIESILNNITNTKKLFYKL